MNKFFLYLVLLPAALWRKMGADMDQLRAILNTRLMLDDRKPVNMMRNQKQKKDRKYSTVINFGAFLVMGIFNMFPVLMVPDRIFSLTMFFSIFLTLITFMLITDFSNVLFDVRDKYILFPRPVNDKTIVLARLLHVFIYLLRIVLPMALPAWVALGFSDGWLSALLFPLPVFLSVLMALFFVNGTYLLVLRIAKPGKFQDIINYFQILASVVFFAVAYLMPRAFDRSNPTDFDITKYPWIKFTPSYWFASCWSWIGDTVLLAGTGIYSVLALAVPIGCMFVLVKYLAPQFAKRIGGIDTVDTGNNTVVGKRTATGKRYQKLANSLNTTDEAKAGFIIGWLQTSRSRSFRMRVYPSFAFTPIYFLYIILQNKNRTLSEAFYHLAETHMNLVLMYMSSFVMITALTYLTMSDQYKAAWVYYATPVEVPGRVMIGALKALIIKFFLPFFLLISAFVIYIWGVSAILDILLALVNITVFVTCIARVSFRYLPFSIVEQMKQSGYRIVKSILSMLMPVTLGFGHYFVVDFLFAKIIFLALSSTFLWYIWTSYATTTWESLYKSNAE